MQQLKNPEKKHGGARPGAGRKPTGETVRGRSFSCPDALWLKIVREAARRDTTPSMLIRQIVDRHFADA